MCRMQGFTGAVHTMLDKDFFIFVAVFHTTTPSF